INVESTEVFDKGDNSKEDENDSKKIPMITHYEALNTIEVLKQCLI
ncbi:758_t:CDS:1, partial [Dentiscutata erythropus]